MSNKNTKSTSKTSRSTKSTKPASYRPTTSSSANKTKLSAKRPTQSPPSQPPNPLVLAVGGAIVLAVILGIVFLLRSRGASTLSTPVSNAANVTTGVLAITLQPNPTAFVAEASPCYTATAPTTQPPANAPKQFSAPQTVIDPTHVYCAFLTTAHGTIIAELFPKSAPQHVNSFVFLAQQGYFDNITWHRVLPGFVAQTGDPTGTGSGGPGYAIPLEIDPALKYDKAGMLAMARTNDPNSAGSQFYITYGPTTSLQDQYTIFGEVVKGMDVATQITPRDPSQNPNAPPGDALISVRILDATTGK